MKEAVQGMIHRAWRRRSNRSSFVPCWASRQRRIPICSACFLFVVAALVTPNPAAGQHYASPETAVEGGREALDQWSAYPWYDAQADDLQRVELREPLAWNWNMDWLLELILWAGWAFLAVIIALVCFYIVRTFLDRERSTEQADRESMRARKPGDALRVEALPFRIDDPQGDLLGEARRQYDAGNYDLAIIYLFSYQLIQLDRHQWIRLARGKTNRQYVREVRRERSLRELLARTMVLFEEVYFGNHRLSRGQFETTWFELDRFESLVVQAS